MRRHEVLALLGGAVPPEPRLARAAEAGLDEAVRFAGGVLFPASKVPALVVGAVVNGRTSIHGFGCREDAVNEQPVGDTLFRIGSVSKAFAGHVLASLVADGIVGLADPLTK
jgi:serine-type D-Ala-D-Ala carboxypeptidase/endopeptidase